MAIYNYDEVKAELVKHEGFNPDSIGKYEGLPLSQNFQNFFQFCQENLSETCVELGYPIQPARMYFSPILSVNAGAVRGKEYSLLRVNMGTIHRLHMLFMAETVLDHPGLKDYKEFDKMLKQEGNPPFEFLLFQMGTLFTYYHELGHLIQFGNQKIAPEEIFEQYTELEDEKFDPIKHIMEFDADQHAANSVAFHIIHYFDKIDKKRKDDLTLDRLVITSLVGILSYIIFLWVSFNKDLYYDRYKHPHPIVRILWILPIIIETVKIKFPAIKSKEILDETMRILDIYLEKKGEGLIRERFIQRTFEEYDNILAYAAQLLAAAGDVPFLCINTVHRNNNRS